MFRLRISLRASSKDFEESALKEAYDTFDLNQENEKSLKKLFLILKFHLLPFTLAFL